MVVFKKTFLLNEEDKQQVAEMTAKIILWLLDGYSVWHMAEQLKMEPYWVERNIDETLYVLKKHVGWKRYLKVLFWK